MCVYKDQAKNKKKKKKKIRNTQNGKLFNAIPALKVCIRNERGEVKDEREKSFRFSSQTYAHYICNEFAWFKMNFTKTTVTRA